MPRQRKRQKPLPISAVNQKCKQFLIRQCFIVTVALSMMAYFLSYEQPNAENPHMFLNNCDLTVMSFNVRNSELDHGLTTKWETRKPVVDDMLSIYNPDLIGLQEASQDQLIALKQSGSGYESFGTFSANSILFKKNRFQFVDGGTLWLSETPKTPSISWDASQQRVVTWILVSEIETESQPQCDDSNDNQQCIDTEGPDESISELTNSNRKGSYLLFNTHLDHRGEHSRLKSCDVIKEAIHEIAIIKYEDQFPVLLTGDFNAAKYGDVWNCLTENGMESEESGISLIDTLHVTEQFGRFRENQVQYTFHSYLGLALNTWYMRTLQYLGFGFSDTVVKWLRDVFFDGICCNAPSLYRQIYRRKEFERNAGIHHLDWILMREHDKIEKVQYFEVVTHHQIIQRKHSQIEWTLKGIFYDRIVAKTVFPSDHFPVVVGVKLKST